MAHRPEHVPVDGEVVLQVEPSSAGSDDDELLLRVSPEHLSDLHEVLEAEGLRHSRGMEFSAGPVLEIVLVTAGTLAAGVAAGLKSALPKFLDRHKDKKIVFGETGNLESVEGYSRRDVERVIDTVTKKQLDEREQFRRMTWGPGTPPEGRDPRA